MPIERLFSLREPKVWGVFALTTVLALIAAIGLELVVRRVLAEVGGISAESADAATLRAAAWLTGLASFVGGSCLAAAVVFARAFTRAVREERLPPSGAWSYGAARIVTGRAAVGLARAGLVLSIGLGSCGLALAGFTGWFVRGVIACAAKNL